MGVRLSGSVAGRKAKRVGAIPTPPSVTRPLLPRLPMVHMAWTTPLGCVWGVCRERERAGVAVRVARERARDGANRACPSYPRARSAARSPPPHPCAPTTRARAHVGAQQPEWRAGGGEPRPPHSPQPKPAPPPPPRSHLFHFFFSLTRQEAEHREEHVDENAGQVPARQGDRHGRQEHHPQHYEQGHARVGRGRPRGGDHDGGGARAGADGVGVQGRRRGGRVGRGGRGGGGGGGGRAVRIVGAVGLHWGVWLGLPGRVECRLKQ